MRLIFLLSSFLLLSSFSSLTVAKSYQSQTLQSPESLVTLIELYTSEGCSSCPPADEWFSSLLELNNLWDDFVPVAFHVDYWDYIGWKDDYAKKAFSHRQRMYALENGEQTVYTPGMRAEGREWRNWGGVDLSVLAESESQKAGVLNLQIADDGSFNASFEQNIKPEHQTDATKPYFLTVALLGLGITTEVKRGENTGRTLEHDFIVLESEDYEIKNSTWNGKLPQSEVDAPHYAIAAWVSSSKSLTPIQAVGGFLE